MSEAKYRHAFPAYRVFIFGLEVTLDTISIVHQRTDGRAPATVSITLVSPNDRYVVNQHDIEDIYNVVSQQRRSVDQDGTDISSYVKLTTQDDMKARVLRAKLSIPPIKVPQDNPLPSSGVVNLLAERYPFQSGLNIFHPMDPVRVFERDPFDPSKWYYMFTGFCSDFLESFGANQEKLVTIVAEDPSKLLRYGRLTSNPGIFDISKQKVIDSIIADISDLHIFANLFSGRTLSEIFFQMLFGDAAQKSNRSSNEMITETMVSVNGTQTLKRRRWGCGHTSLEKSCVYLYGSNTPTAKNDPVTGIPPALNHKSIKTLGEYQKELDHIVDINDLTSLRLDEYGPSNYTAPNVSTIEQVITEIGSHPEVYPIDGGRLAILLPVVLGSDNRELVVHDLVGSFALNTEWVTRAEVLYDVIDNIEFVFYVSPKGDYVVEFPLFDFMPEDFGEYAKYYNVTISDTCHIETAFSDTKIHTQAVSAWQVAQNYSFSQNLHPITRQFITLWHLIPLFGVRQAPMTSKGYIATSEAARLYANISLNRLNADAFTQRAVIIPNIQMWLNRPIRMDARTHIGTAKSIVQSITWGMQGDMSTELGLYAMRAWDGTVDQDNNAVYFPIGGPGSRPFDYATLFNRPQTSKKTRQVAQKVTTKGGAS